MLFVKKITNNRIALFCMPILIMMLLMTAACEKEVPLPQPRKSSEFKAESEQNEDLFTIRYRLKWLHQAQFAGAYMAKEKGFYRDRGLNVEILPGGVGYPPYQSLIQGKSDVSNINLITAVQYYHVGPALVNLVQISQKNSTLLVGKKSSSLQSIDDLNGKRIGIWRDESGEYVRLFLEYYNYDVQIVPIEWSVNLLLNNAIDLMNAMMYNEFHRILMTGWDEDELVKFDLSDYGFDLADDGIYATKEFYDQNKEECINFAEATMDGWIYALNNREETLDVVIRYLRKIHLPANRDHQAWMLDHMHERVLRDPKAIGHLNQKDFDKVHNLLLEQGLISQTVDYKTFYPNEIKKKN